VICDSDSPRTSGVLLAIVMTLGSVLLGCAADRGQAAPAPASPEEARLPDGDSTSHEAPAPTTAAPLAEAAVFKRVDENLSTGVVEFGDINLQLELGRWSVGAVNRLLDEAHLAKLDPSGRLAFLVDRFQGTAFEYESHLPIPPRDVLRVRLESFGCAGFTMYMLALSSAKNFEEFAHNLRAIRYRETEARGVDSDPTVGNIFDFAFSAYENAAERGYVQDVTRAVAGGAALTAFRTRFLPRRRTAEYDPGKRLLVPKSHPGELVTVDMIGRKTFQTMDRSAIRTGDILLFSRVKPGAPGDTLMVGHLGVAKNVDGEIYLTHATRDYLWNPEATADTPATGTGVFIEGDRRREQLGVAPATTWVSDPDGRKIKVKGKSYYGYHPTELRPLTDYIGGAHIEGIRVLRPLERQDVWRTRDLEFRKASQRVTPDATLSVIDAAMTHEQALRKNLRAGAPEAIVSRLSVVDVSYPGVDDKTHQGQIVVHEELVQDVHRLFETIRETKFPVTSVIPMSNPTYLKDGLWDDQTSMLANNTSSFNYRVVKGSRVLSRHACGRAIDLNPLINPLIRGKGARQVVEPPGAVYEPSKAGTLTADHPIVKRMKAMGWTWGGDFKSLKDYQHFEKGNCKRSL
jgi:hypothetical protein